MDLLASGHGQRLLISGVHPSATDRRLRGRRPATSDIFDCCVDLDRSALNTFGNATETRRWAREHNFRSLIVVTSPIICRGRWPSLRHQLPEVTLIPFPVVTEKMRERPWWSSAADGRLLVRST